MTPEDLVGILLLFEIVLFWCFCLSRKLFVMVYLGIFLIGLLLSWLVWVTSHRYFLLPGETVVMLLGYMLGFLFVTTTFRLLRTNNDASRVQRLKAISLDLESASPTMDIIDQLLVAKKSQNVKFYLQVVKKLSDPVLLQEISSEVKNRHIQQLATAKLELLNVTAEECF